MPLMKRSERTSPRSVESLLTSCFITRARVNVLDDLFLHEDTAF
jgi:hypothetical protein